MNPTLHLLSSMATRAWLAQAQLPFEQHSGLALRIESVGGVEAARRVRAGEAFDVVFLASDAIESLLSEGLLKAGSRVDVVRSEVSVAVAESAQAPDMASEEALRQAVLNAECIGYSTGPSGTQLLKLFDRWGLRETLGSRLMQAPAGVPVAQLIADGRVSLGFQQTSELIHTAGVKLLGPMPAACAISTLFSAGIGVHCTRQHDAHQLLSWLSSDETAAGKRAQGMEPA